MIAAVISMCMRYLALFVIPGRRAAASPESSHDTTRRLDSGLAGFARAPE
jgi:hypothetical protein